jgi:hypothetical protein
LPIGSDVTPYVIWEEPEGGAPCGPSTIDVRFNQGTTLVAPVVHWEVAGVRGDAPMTITLRETATATVGPFPADTLEDGTNHEMLVYVTDRDVFGEEIFRAPTVVLRDCSP